MNISGICHGYMEIEDIFLRKTEYFVVILKILETRCLNYGSKANISNLIWHIYQFRCVVSDDLLDSFKRNRWGSHCEMLAKL